MRKTYLVFLLILFIPIVAIAQQTTVSGVVISADDGEPVIGASVTVKGNTGIGTVTDLDGKFVLSIPAGTKKIVVSYVGMKSQEVTPQSGTMKITLESDAQQLGEVVVTGMQKMDKRLFTGATTKIDAADAKLDGMADISRSLEGRAAGVSVQNVSGTFGTAPKIRVRGATSIYGSSRPLWVVDGVVMEDAVEISADDLSSGDAVTLISSAIAGLNADDIESFQVLKDGSATSIYGARAMAGVVVITTKKGQAGKSRINYTGEFSIRMKPSYRDFNISNSQEQMGIYKEMESKGWLEFASLATGSNTGIYGKMYEMIDHYNGNGQYGLPFTQTDMNNYLREAEYRNTDWFDLLFNTNVTQNHAVSVSSGTEKAQFYASLSFMNDPGWTKSSSVQRYTFNANAIFSLSKYVKLTMLTSDSYREQKAPGTLSQELDIVSGEVKREFDINPYSYALNTSRTLDPNAMYKRNYSKFNIFNELNNNYMDIGVTDLKFQAELEWKPVRGLEIKLLGAYRTQKAVQEHFIKDQSNQAMAYRAGIYPEDAVVRDSNPYLYTDPENPNALPETVLPKGGIYYNDGHNLSQYDFRGTVQYNTALNDTHIFNFFAGTEVNSTDRNTTNFQGWGFCYDLGNMPFIDYNLFKQQSEENASYYSYEWLYGRSLAYFASGTYSYKGKYTLNLTGRYEGTNKLGKSRKSRWLPTYNIAGAWNLHEESWFENSVLSHATLKASYSLTGDRGPANVTNATAVLKPSRPWRPLSNVQEIGLQLADIANSELTYEKKKEFNVGIDVGFLDNRINLSADYYIRRNKDLIGDIYTQGAGGAVLKKANVAAMDAHGIEATLSTRNIVTKDFKWTTDFTFSDARNEISKLDARSNIISLVSGNGFAREGYPVRALFSIPFVGLNDEGLPQFINQDGKVTVDDLNFQEFEKVNFLKYEGPADAPITGGFGNIFTYKNFRLNIFMTYSFGNVVRLDPFFSNRYDDMTAMPKEFKNRWTLPGDEQYTNIPAIASKRQDKNYSYLNYAYNAYNYSTERIAKGSFIRMKEISLTYDFTPNMLKRIGLSSASLKVQGTNLFLLYADKKLNGQDPEFFNSGGVATPNPKQFTITLRLGI